MGLRKLKDIGKKVLGGAKKVVRKVVPKEVSGIMTAAAPFVAPYSLPAAAALSIGGQLRTGQGRINPILTGASLLPGIRFAGGDGLGAFRPTGFTRFGPQDFGPSTQVGLKGLLFGQGPGQTGQLGQFGETAEKFLFGSPVSGDYDQATQGLLGKGGEYDILGSKLLSSTDDKGNIKLSKTKVATAVAAGLSLTQTQAQIEEEGLEDGLSSGEIARLQAEAAEMWKDFDTTAFRPNVKDGGLMRVKLSEGTPKPRGLSALMGGVLTDIKKEKEPEYYDYFKDISSKPNFVMPEGSDARDNLSEAMLFRDNDMAKAEKLIDEQGLDKLYEEAVKIVKDNDEANEYFLSLVNNKDLNISAADAYYSVIKKFGDKRVNRREGSEGNELPPDPTTPVNPFKPKPIGPVLPNKAEVVNPDILRQMFLEALKNGEIPPGTDFDTYKDMMMTLMSKTNAKQGGLMRSNFALGTKPTKEESGLGGLPIEADMRYSGGFMPYGAKEKADDVPARLSKNEFVFTADAVRAAGGGSVQKGAQKMYNSMKQLEQMGRSFA
jgi:hypothetical protein